MDHSPPDASPPNAVEPGGHGRRRLRAVLAADVANFGGLVSVDETNTLDALLVTRRIAREELAASGGWLFGMPGDGIFALFESAVDAVCCALNTQQRLAASPKLNMIRLRIGVHLGEVLFRDGLPFGEPLVIAARLESLAEPGGILVSAAVMEAVASRISAAFSERGVFSLKHSPRRVLTFSVTPSPPAGELNETSWRAEPLDRTMLSGAPEPADAKPATPVIDVTPAAATLPSLPKAVQLVLPAGSHDAPCSDGRARPDAMAPSGCRPVHTPLPDVCVGELTQALTAHVGPVARLLVKRHAATCADPAELVDALAAEIPTKAERLQFLIRAQDVVARQRR